MRAGLLASLTLLTACSITPESAEPTPPPAPDAAVSPTPSPLIFASQYDRACMRDDDCVAAFDGNACASCRCANAAIRRDALPRYRVEIGAYWACYTPEACGADCTAVIGDPAICVAGTCALPGL